MISERAHSANTTHWIGIDVAKQDFQAALAHTGQKWPATALRELPVKRFARSPEGVQTLLAWLRTLMQAEFEGGTIRVIMESTGKYSIELIFGKLQFLGYVLLVL